MKLSALIAAAILLAPMVVQAKSALTEQEAIQICSSVVDAVNAGAVTDYVREFSAPSEDDVETYEDSFWFGWGAGTLTGVLKLDYDGDGEVETLGRIEGQGGDCLCGIADLEALDTIAYPGVAAYRHANGCDRVMIIDGKPLVVSGARGRLSSVNIVSWLSPEGEKRPLCFLARDPVSRVVVDRSRDNGLCRSIVNDTAYFLPWAMTVEGNEAKQEAYGGNLPGPGEVHWASAALDIDMDGKKEKIGLMRRIREGGCMAWELQFLDGELSPAGESRLNGLRQSSLSFYRGDPKLKPRPMFFEAYGKPYVLADGDYADAEVLSFHNGRPSSICEFEVFRRHRIKQMLPLDE